MPTAAPRMKSASPKTVPSARSGNWSRRRDAEDHVLEVRPREDDGQEEPGDAEGERPLRDGLDERLDADDDDDDADQEQRDRHQFARQSEYHEG
ncbi:hypothetical protein ACFQL0_17920 [Haloplanus litoreus]|uniref:hypothetical protein n=1 Tax=Haloplanus litoreus TaxID=767515 RepID=UPI0036089C23